jgi:hypothetical protein
MGSGFLIDCFVINKWSLASSLGIRAHIIMNIKDWAILSVPSPELQLVSQLFSFPVDCSGMIVKGFGFVVFCADVKASSFCIYLSCLVCIQSVVRGVWSRLFYGSGVPRGCSGVQNPRNCRVFTKLSRISSSMKYTSITNDLFITLQIECNPRLGGYYPQIPILSALSSTDVVEPPPPPSTKKFLV